MYKRETYNTIKSWYLDSVYDACKRIYSENRIFQTNESEWGYAIYNFENSFEKPIENLMLYTIHLISECRRFPKSHNIILDMIKDILKKYDINDMIKELEDKEKIDFLYDLDLVLNNREIE